MSARERVTVESLHAPNYKTTLDAEKFNAMRDALLKVLPEASPGLTFDEMVDAVKPHLPPALWPGGEKVGWWLKSVQLDQEAKGVIVREATKPLRWRRVER